MKKLKNKEDFPFLKDPKHIYNILTDKSIGGVNIGWAFMEFQLVGELTYQDVVCDGVTLFSERQIQFEIALDDKDARETILHEIIHCCLETVGLDERNFSGNQITTTNEIIALAVSKQLVVINNLNPGLMELLYAKG